MAQVITFEDYTPVPRYDELPWTQARIEEAETSEGPWNTLETIALDPVDADPRYPATRNFTTELASDEPALWYRIVFLDASGDVSQPTAPVQNVAPEATTRDLCVLDDVRRYVPGYVPNSETNDVLVSLITSESEAIHHETGRLILPWASQPETREYEIDAFAAHLRRVNIDDLASAGDSDITVELVDPDGTTVETIDRAAYRPLYELRRNPRAPWEPVTTLEFPAALGGPTMTAGQTLLVTGNFGFPEIPPFIVEACAKRVILRYASDVAAAGTQLAAAIAELNLAGLFASARDDVDRLKRLTVMIG